MIEVKVLKTPGCGHCAMVMKELEELKEEFDLNIVEVDVAAHPEEAMKYGVMVSPGIVINGKLATQGGVSKEELRKKLEELG